jgi:hypothetical protein
MVFCDEPWYNEPGREKTRDDQSSAQYNSSIRAWTIEHAMLSWLSDAGGYQQASKLLWQDVVEKHFSAKAPTILKWLGADSLHAENIKMLRHILASYTTATG